MFRQVFPREEINLQEGARSKCCAYYRCVLMRASLFLHRKVQLLRNALICRVSKSPPLYHKFRVGRFCILIQDRVLETISNTLSTADRVLAVLLQFALMPLTNVSADSIGLC